MFVSQSESYIDKLTEKLREIDVTAVWTGMGPGKTWVNFNAVAECKSGNKVWITFVDAQDETLDALEPQAWLAWMPKVTSHIVDQHIEDIFEAHVLKDKIPALINERQLAAYGITQMRTSSGEKDAAHIAVRQVVSASVGFVDRVSNRATTSSHYTLAVPIIVTDGPLFRCSLADDSSIKVEPSEREVLLTQTDDGKRFVAVHVLQECALPQFVRDCDELIRHLLVSSGSR